MKRNNNRAVTTIAAQQRKQARAERHAAMLARHEARNAAIAAYEAAYTDWCNREQAAYEAGTLDWAIIGPCPLDPRYRDFSLFPENRPVAA